MLEQNDDNTESYIMGPNNSLGSLKSYLEQLRGVRRFGRTDDARNSHGAESMELKSRLPGELQPKLPGEVVRETFNITQAKLYITNYRVVVNSFEKWAPVAIPLLTIESALVEEHTCVVVTCRNGRTFGFLANSEYTAWAIHDRIQAIVTNPPKREEIFAFQVPSEDLTLMWLWRPVKGIGLSPHALEKEFERLGFSDRWQISSANADFRICATYPEQFIVPSEATEEMLTEAAGGRFLGRIPTAVWREPDSGAVLLRCSQPVISYTGYSTPEDVDFVDLCCRTAASSPDVANLVIRDCRSKAAALMNRAKGGGYENTDVYQNCEVKFMDLPNIHAVRKAFSEFRTVLAEDRVPKSDCAWMSTVYRIIKSAKKCLEDLANGKTVLVHCSDGWDRTTQIVALAKLMGDGYYRSIEGFEVLVRSDWIGFGHKFSDRNSVFNNCHDQEKSPIFLQWLDCVYQLCAFNPTAFEFNTNYLVKVAQHSYSGLFGTFLFNSIKEYKDCLQEAGCESLPSLWAFLNHQANRVRFENHNYNPTLNLLTIPSKRDISVWHAAYRPETLFSGDKAHRCFRRMDEDGIVDISDIGGSPPKRSEDDYELVH